MDVHNGSGREIQIVRLVDAGPQRATLVAGINAIFFETAPTAPTAEPERAAFYDLWLGQYLRHDTEQVYLARLADDSIVGYLVGCWDNPAEVTRFASLAFFQAFADQCAQYPGHLHLNLTAAYRGRGVGAALVEAFVRDSRAAGVRGVHVVTAAAARNVGFYTRLGFLPRATIARKGRDLVLLGRDLAQL